MTLTFHLLTSNLLSRLFMSISTKFEVLIISSNLKARDGQTDGVERGTGKGALFVCFSFWLRVLD